MPNDPFDSRDESGQHPAVGDVPSDLSSNGSSSAVPDRKVSVLCPYCGRPTILGARCEQCKGLLDPLSRQATQNAMGPWFIHDPANPFRPGCSYDVIRDMARRGRLVADTVLRGPTTRQYWMTAARAPSVANLLGSCHNCRKAVEQSAVSCPSCGADFTPELDRQYLGLGPVHLLPGQASPEEVARHASSNRSAVSQAGVRQDRQGRESVAPGGPRSSDAGGTPEPETGEYRALVDRVERLDRELGAARVLAGIAGVAVVVLAAAVLWFSGVFQSGGVDPPGSWLSSDEPPAKGQSPSQPAGLTPAPETVEESPASESPVDPSSASGLGEKTDPKPATSPEDVPDPLPDDPGLPPVSETPVHPAGSFLASQWRLVRTLP